MVSIIILACNKSAYTRACVQSIFGTQPTDYELVIVDNGSTDDTPQLLEEMQRQAKQLGVRLAVLRPGQNIGCSTARNMAVSEARGEEVVFLDNDTIIPDPAWLGKLRAVLRSDRAIAVVGPKICYPFEPHRIQCAGVGISRTGRVQFRGRGDARDDTRFGRTEDVQCLISACFMFPKALYDEIGGLDEAFNPIQYEDFDFCYRARSRGRRVVYTPDPIVYHWESITSDGTPAIQNRHVIIKHGMLFKERWRGMFEKEDGPSDDETRWTVIEMPSLDGLRRR